jgi:hypothetical protein
MLLHRLLLEEVRALIKSKALLFVSAAAESVMIEGRKAPASGRDTRLVMMMILLLLWLIMCLAHIHKFHHDASAIV